MASISLGLGTSNTPMLNVKREEWPRFGESDPTIKRLRDKTGAERAASDRSSGTLPRVR